MTVKTANRKDINRRFAAYAAVGAAGAAFAGVQEAQADFSGAYAHANWTPTLIGDASILTATLSTLTIDGEELSGIGGDSLYMFTAVAGGTVSFDWAVISGDGGNWDYGGWVKNGTFTTLANNAAAPTGGSNVNFTVNVGDTFGFFVFSADGAYGGMDMTITNFSGPAIPAPAGLAVLAAGALGLRRRSRKN